MIHCDTHNDEHGKPKEARYVCHHCGRPLCNANQLPEDARERKGKFAARDVCGYMLLDKMLWAADGKGAPTYHCEECLTRYHPEMVADLGKFKTNLKR